MAIKGGAARLLMMSAYFLAFCCSIIITGAFAWVRPTTETTSIQRTTSLLICSQFTARETRSRNLATLIMGIASLLWSFTSFLLICVSLQGEDVRLCLSGTTQAPRIAHRPLRGELQGGSASET